MIPLLLSLSPIDQLPPPPPSPLKLYHIVEDLKGRGQERSDALKAKSFMKAELCGTGWVVAFLLLVVVVMMVVRVHTHGRQRHRKPHLTPPMANYEHQTP